MPARNWSDQENDLVVADYFAMLAKELAGQPYNKTEHRLRLRPLLQDRSDKSVEFKHQNISAILRILGEQWIVGYRPAQNFQRSLIDAVERWLDAKTISYPQHPQLQPSLGPSEHPLLYIGPPPTLSNHPAPPMKDFVRALVRKYDRAGRDETNRALGRAGEELVLDHEKAVLTIAGRQDLARQVKWVSVEEGDGAGYDIASFTPEGARRLIEVKTTNGGWDRTPFHISRNELAVAEQKRSEWCLFRLWNFAREPRAFELYPPLDAHVSLTATIFQASFH